MTFRAPGRVRVTGTRRASFRWHVSRISALTAALVLLSAPGSTGEGGLAGQAPGTTGAGRPPGIAHRPTSVLPTTPPSPSVRLYWRGGTGRAAAVLELEVTPPPAWELYAPRTPAPARLSAAVPRTGDHRSGASVPQADPARLTAEDDPFLLGRPLEVSVPGGGRVQVLTTDPLPAEKSTPQGIARVFTGPVHLTLDVLPAGTRRLRIRWALCREDRCVPGTSTVRVPGRGPVRD